MNSDFRTPTSFYNDVHTARLQRRLGDSGIAALFFLRCYTALYKAEGILANMDEEDIEFAAKWHGGKGKLVPTLLDLHFLDQSEDGTYSLHAWQETNPWAADVENRSDKARLSGMARNYPELFEELTSQGYVGIDRATYAKLTAEYNRRGILRSSSDFLRNASESLAPTPRPAPAPEPFPAPSPITTHKEASSSASLEKVEPETQPQIPQAETTKQAASAPHAEAKAKAKPKTSIKAVNLGTEADDEAKQLTIPFKDEETQTQTPEPKAQASQLVEQEVTPEPETATLRDVMKQWNRQLGSIGFMKVQRVTAVREKAFLARLRGCQERLSLDWWIALFDKIAASDFMCESARQKANWLTLDWVLRESNMMKVLEGKYDSERPVTADIRGKVFRGKRASASKQSAVEPDSTVASGNEVNGIPETSLQRINEMRAMFGKAPMSQDKESAGCIEAEFETESSIELPEKVENDVPTSRRYSPYDDVDVDAMSEEEYEAMMDDVARQIAEEEEECRQQSEEEMRLLKETRERGGYDGYVGW